MEACHIDALCFTGHKSLLGPQGIGGMLLMIPLASVLYTLLGEFTHKRLAERNIPEEKLIGKPLEIKSQFRKNRERKQNLRLRKMQDKLKEKMQKK